MHGKGKAKGNPPAQQKGTSGAPRAVKPAKVCGHCADLMAQYKIDEAAAKRQCQFCVSRGFATVQKDARGVYDILFAFATGKVFPTTVNPREVAGLVWTLDNGMKPDSDLGRCVKLTGLKTEHLDADLVADVIKDTLVDATSYRQRSGQPRLDHHVWLGTEKPKDEIRVPNIFSDEPKKLRAKDIITENKTSVDVEATEGSGGGKRYSIYGHNVTGVLRWMGKAGWTVKQAKVAITKLGLPVADATLQAQIRAGLLGTRGDPASLTGPQQDALTALKGESQCPTNSAPSATTTRTAPTAAVASQKPTSGSGKATTLSSSPVPASGSAGRNTSSKSSTSKKTLVKTKKKTKGKTSRR